MTGATRAVVTHAKHPAQQTPRTQDHTLILHRTTETLPVASSWPTLTQGWHHGPQGSSGTLRITLCSSPVSPGNHH